MISGECLLCLFGCVYKSFLDIVVVYRLPFQYGIILYWHQNPHLQQFNLLFYRQCKL